jgi:hypothetical protein
LYFHPFLLYIANNSPDFDVQFRPFFGKEDEEGEVDE